MIAEPDRQGGDGLEIELLPQSVSQDDKRVSVHFDFGDSAAAAAFRIKVAFRIKDGDFAARFDLAAPHQPTRDAAEGATRARCPRCKTSSVTIDRARKPLSDSLVCVDCNYVGPIGNENYETMRSAAPQPAPDAMREALELIERTCHVRAATIARDALRSAPVPSPDGGVTPSPDGAQKPSALRLNASQNTAESDLSETPDCRGAETAAKLFPQKCPHGNSSWRMCHLCNPD